MAHQRGIGIPPMGSTKDNLIPIVPACTNPHGRDARATPIASGIGVPPMGSIKDNLTANVHACAHPHGRDARATPIATDGPILPRISPIEKRQGANLPHWTTDGATYFVTFRLADSLPAKALIALKQERDRLLRGIGVPPMDSSNDFMSDDKRTHINKLFSEKIESYLDAGTGACHMNNPAIAQLIQSALTYFHSKRYFLFAWAIMPNHIHVVVRPTLPHGLSEITHSWKSFTSKAANKLLHRVGPFWQAESYDHLVRDQDDLIHCIRYTRENPLKANLKNWPWIGTFQDIPSTDDQ